MVTHAFLLLIWKYFQYRFVKIRIYIYDFNVWIYYGVNIEYQQFTIYKQVEFRLNLGVQGSGEVLGGSVVGAR